MSRPITEAMNPPSHVARTSNMTTCKALLVGISAVLVVPYLFKNFISESPLMCNELSTIDGIKTEIIELENHSLNLYIQQNRIIKNYISTKNEYEELIKDLPDCKKYLREKEFRSLFLIGSHENRCSATSDECHKIIARVGNKIRKANHLGRKANENDAIVKKIAERIHHLKDNVVKTINNLSSFCRLFVDSRCIAKIEKINQ